MNRIDIKAPRREIEEAINSGNLQKLLEITGLLHGHFCPGVALGVKAGAIAMKELGVTSTGMEEVVAIVETNNCFSDGIQVVTGCSFGNNALIYRDHGKTVVTLARRNGEAIRISVKTNGFLKGHYPELPELFDKVVVRRKGKEADGKRLKEIWSQLSFKMLEIDDNELFKIRREKITVPPYSCIFANIRCSICGEDVMESRARIRDGKPICIPCSDVE